MPRSIRLTIRQTNRRAWLVGVLVLMVSAVTSPHLQAQDSRTQLDELKTGFMRPPQAAKPSAYCEKNLIVSKGTFFASISLICSGGSSSKISANSMAISSAVMSSPRNENRGSLDLL